MQLAGGLFGQRDGLVGLARSDHVQSSVDGGPAQIAFGTLQLICTLTAADQSQEDRLQHVFRVSGIARNPVSGPEDKAVVVLKRFLQFVRNCDGRFL